MPTPSVTWPRNGIYAVAPETWMVPSRKTAPGAYWLVRRVDRDLTCTCPAGIATAALPPHARNGCHHVRSVVAALTQEAGTSSKRAEQLRPGDRIWMSDQWRTVEHWTLDRGIVRVDCTDGAVMRYAVTDRVPTWPEPRPVAPVSAAAFCD